MQNGIAEAAVQEWCRNVPAVSTVDFRRHAFRWLRFHGRLEESVRDAHPHTRQVETFAAWMRDDGGLSEATIGNCYCESDRLFAWAAGRNSPKEVQERTLTLHRGRSHGGGIGM